MTVRSLGWLCFGALLTLGQPLMAVPPWKQMVVFKQVEANPNEDYAFTQQNGPWTIMAATFTGEGAGEQAHDLIYELRKEFKLPAYSYQKKFEYSKPVVGNGLDRYGDPIKMRYRQGKDLIEVAVLVGDYPTVDDPEAQKVLKKLKYMQPKALANEKGQATHQSLAEMRAVQKQVKQAVLPKDSDELKRGPMAGAFVITNPILPNEYFVPKGLDKLVVDMNKNVPHSLLNCKHKYTVQVATFTGHAILLDRKASEAIESGVKPKSWLEDAAAKAHLITESLREKGYEAYEFHDRSSSIVTVGGFDSIGTELPDKRIELDPKILKIMTVFGVETKKEPGKAAQVGKPREIQRIPLDVQPKIVNVPSRSISADYARNATSNARERR